MRPAVLALTIGGNDVLGWYGDTSVLGTVYDPGDGTADASRVGLPPWPEVVDVLAHLNAALRDLADRQGVAVADIHGRFRGHGLAVGDPGQPEPRPADRDLWYCNVIEPNAWGASAVRAAFWEALHGEPGPTGGALQEG